MRRCHAHQRVGAPLLQQPPPAALTELNASDVQEADALLAQEEGLEGELDILGDLQDLGKVSGGALPC